MRRSGILALSLTICSSSSTGILGFRKKVEPQGNIVAFDPHGLLERPGMLPCCALLESRQISVRRRLRDCKWTKNAASSGDYWCICRLAEEQLIMQLSRRSL